MLTILYKSLLTAHILLGVCALVLFWLPIISRKGNQLHRQSGRYYSWCMHLVAASGIFITSLIYLAGGLAKPELAVAAASNPERYQLMLQQNSFLFMLSLLSWVTIRHADLVLKTKTDRSVLKHWTVLAPVLLLLFIAVRSYFAGGVIQVLVWVFATISLSTTISILRYSFKSQVCANAWLIEHAAAMLASGIAAYTAFSAFGGRALLSGWLAGYWQILPWLLPSLLGVPAIYWYKHKLKAG